MNKIWTIARYEYIRHVRRRAFQFTALGLPLLMASIFGLIILVVLRSGVEQRIGIVDETRRFAAVDVNALDLRRPIPVEQFADETAARAAFDAGRTDAFIVIPEDYLETGKVRSLGRRKLSEAGQTQVERMLEAGLLAEAPPENRGRLGERIDMVLRTPDGGREISANNVLLFLLPYAFALLFVTITFTTSGYLLQAVTEEKEDRVMEILATTVSPGRMIMGKVLGLSGVGLTQTLIWLLIGLVSAVAISRDTSWLAEISLPWQIAALAVAYFLLGYLLIASCYTAIGASVPTPQEAQPLAGPVSLLAMAPFFLLIVILSNPNGTLAVVLSLIPFSAPLTMLMRLPLADIPAWQIVTSMLLLVLSALGVMFLAGRAMRLGMLRYGKRLSLADLFRAG